MKTQRGLPLSISAAMSLLVAVSIAAAQETSGLKLVRYGPVGEERPGLIDVMHAGIGPLGDQTHEVRAYSKEALEEYSRQF